MAGMRTFRRGSGGGSSGGGASGLLRARASGFSRALADDRDFRDDQRVTGVDPVGVGDVPVLVPDLGPQIGVPQEAAREVPQRVALDHDVVGRAVGDGVGALVLRPVRRDGRRPLEQSALGCGGGRRPPAPAWSSRPPPRRGSSDAPWGARRRGRPGRGPARVPRRRTGFPKPSSLPTSWTGAETVPKSRTATTWDRRRRPGTAKGRPAIPVESSRKRVALVKSFLRDSKVTLELIGPGAGATRSRVGGRAGEAGWAMRGPTGRATARATARGRAASPTPP